MRFEIYGMSGVKWGSWGWRLVAGNGKVIADGGEGYRSRPNARRAVNRLRGLLTVDIPVVVL